MNNVTAINSTHALKPCSKYLPSKGRITHIALLFIAVALLTVGTKGKIPGVQALGTFLTIILGTTLASSLSINCMFRKKATPPSHTTSERLPSLTRAQHIDLTIGASKTSKSLT